MENEKTYYITPEHIGALVTIDQAEAVADWLTDHGYQSVAHDTCGVTPRGYADADKIPDCMWMAAMDAVFCD